MLNKNLANLRHCFVIVLDQTNSAIALKFLESLKPQDDSLYLFCKLDSVPYSSSFLYVAAKKASMHTNSADKEEFRTPIQGASIHLFDAAALSNSHFLFLQHSIELVSSSLKPSNTKNLAGRVARSLLDDALDIWGSASTLIVLPSNDTNLLGLVRHARHCGTQIMPIESQYDAPITSIPNPIVNASGAMRASLNTALHHCNNRARTDLPFTAANKIAQKALAEKTLELSLFTPTFLENICLQYGEEFGIMAQDSLDSMVASSDVIRRIITQKICDSLRTYSGELSDVNNEVEKLADYWSRTKIGTQDSLRVWLLNTLNEEHPFLLYDYLLDRVNARVDSSPVHVTVFATNPVRHIRRPRIDLSNISMVKGRGASSHTTNAPSLNWYSRRYSTNVILAKHIPGTDPNYPRLDCVFTNGLLLALTKEKSLSFLESIKKCLNPGGLIVTTTAEQEKLELNHVPHVQPALQMWNRIQTLNFGNVDAAKFYRVYRPKNQDSSLWT